MGISSAQSHQRANPFLVPLEVAAVDSTAPRSRVCWPTWEVPSVHSRLHRGARMLQSTAGLDPNSRRSVREKNLLSDKYHGEKKKLIHICSV